MNKTATEWLQEPDLPTALAVAFGDGKWKHKITSSTLEICSDPTPEPEPTEGYCCKCGYIVAIKGHCSVPDPIDINDLGQAIRMLRKVWDEAKAAMLIRDTYAIAAEVWRAEHPDRGCYSPQEIDKWLWRQASAKQMLIIAAAICSEKGQKYG